MYTLGYTLQLSVEIRNYELIMMQELCTCVMGTVMLHTDIPL